MENGNTYNGWTNYETWLVQLWLDSYIQGLVHNGEEVTERHLENYVDSMMDNIDWQSMGLFKDLITNSMGNINWEEIAESAKELEGY